MKKPELNKIPLQPGIYMFISKNETILYVGKAKLLRKRVSNYFSSSQKTIKTERMLSNAVDIKFIVTKNEVEAFLLESNLIKTEKPKYNILLKDSKGYPYIKLTGDTYPKIMISRNTTDLNSQYFGPFVNTSGLRDIVHSLQKIFPLRDCSDIKFKEGKLCMNYQIKRCPGPCENAISHKNYMLNVDQLKRFFSGNTKAVRDHFVTLMKQKADQLKFEEASIYRDRLKSLDYLFANQSVMLSGFEKFLDGFVFHSFSGISGVTMMIIRNSQLIGTKTELFEDELSKETMESYIIQFYNNLRQFPAEVFIIEPENMINKQLVLATLKELSGKKITLRQKGVKGLIEHGQNNGKLQTDLFTRKKEHNYYAINKLQNLFAMDDTPKKIECIDISHLSGDFTVGVSIAWEDNDFANKSYRKYKINSAHNDDFQSIYELISRKLKRIKDGDETMADIFIIDGGIGQLNITKKAFDDLNMVGNIMSISKGRSIHDQQFDTIQSIESLHIFGRMNPLNLKRHDKLLLFVQKLRDEAHRFVIEYSRKLALKELTKSPLLEIEGVGAKRLKTILIQFPDIHSNQTITAEQLGNMCKIPKNIANNIISYLNQDE